MPYRAAPQHMIWSPEAIPPLGHTDAKHRDPRHDDPSEVAKQFQGPGRGGRVIVRAAGDPVPNTFPIENTTTNDVKFTTFVTKIIGFMKELNLGIFLYKKSLGMDISKYTDAVKEYNDYINNGPHGMDIDDDLMIEPVIANGYLTDVRVIAHIADHVGPLGGSHSSSYNSVWP